MNVAELPALLETVEPKGFDDLAEMRASPLQVYEAGSETQARMAETNRLLSNPERQLPGFVRQGVDLLVQQLSTGTDAQRMAVLDLAIQRLFTKPQDRRNPDPNLNEANAMRIREVVQTLRNKYAPVGAKKRIERTR